MLLRHSSSRGMVGTRGTRARTSRSRSYRHEESSTSRDFRPGRLASPGAVSPGRAALLTTGAVRHAGAVGKRSRASRSEGRGARALPGSAPNAAALGPLARTVVWHESRGVGGGGGHRSGDASTWTSGVPLQAGGRPQAEQGCRCPRAGMRGRGCAGLAVSHNRRGATTAGGATTARRAPQTPVVAGRADREDEGRRAGGGPGGACGAQSPGPWKRDAACAVTRRYTHGWRPRDSGGRAGHQVRCNAALHPPSRRPRDPGRRALQGGVGSRSRSCNAALQR